MLARSAVFILVLALITVVLIDEGKEKIVLISWSKYLTKKIVLFIAVAWRGGGRGGRGWGGRSWGGRGWGGRGWGRGWGGGW